jgi:hypothetical protein
VSAVNRIESTAKQANAHANPQCHL